PVFRFLYLRSGSLTLDGLRFEHGCAVAGSLEGGGLFADEDTELVMTDVTISDFTGFATVSLLRGGFLFFDGESLVIEGSTFDGISLETAEGGLDGGVVRFFSASAAVLVSDSVFSNIQATSGDGLQGAVVNSQADMTIVDTAFEDVNVSSRGRIQGGAVYSGSSTRFDLERLSFRRLTGSSSEGNVQGGAIYATVLRFSLQDGTFSDFTMSAAGDCEGGALYNSANGLSQGLIFERISCSSGEDMKGAAFYVRNASDFALRDCVFRDNEGRFAGSGGGGAAFVETTFAPEVNLDIERCAFIDNRLAPASSTSNGSALGGALSAERIRSMRNVTFSGNIAQAGDGLEAVADGGSAFGGAIYLGDDGAASSIAHVTLANNRAIAGAGADGFADGVAHGGGLYTAATSTVGLIGSILAGNLVTDGDDFSSAEDCFSAGTLASSGYNLAQTADPSCDFSAFGDVTDLDPELYPVDDYGCSVPLLDGTCVPTAAVDHTSWAVDWASCADAGLVVAGLVDDARGLARRQDIVSVGDLADGCDVGAFEARDADGDGVTDVADLCPDDPDSDQSDSDGDLVGDACDFCEGDNATGDSDGDGVCGDLDLCAGDDASGDSDGDGVCDDADATVGDRVWLDDGDGIQDGGEPGVAGVTVNLYDPSDALLDSVDTDGDGRFSFSPGPGDYYLEFVPPADLAFAP
ncbi:MAG: SdrD B-like domain-containing protein, partial [Acidobacteriota bacterium]